MAPSRTKTSRPLPDAGAEAGPWLGAMTFLDGAEAPLGRLGAGLDGGEATRGAGQSVSLTGVEDEGSGPSVVSSYRAMLRIRGPRDIRGGT